MQIIHTTSNPPPFSAWVNWSLSSQECQNNQLKMVRGGGEAYESSSGNLTMHHTIDVLKLAFERRYGRKNMDGKKKFNDKDTFLFSEVNSSI